MNIYAQRLLNVAKACRETSEPDRFYMGAYVHPCGTPACALGNYAARQDLQSELRIKIGRVWSDIVFRDDPSRYCGQNSGRLHDHFGIEPLEAKQLFGEHGCGGARTAVQAAEYIERFVARKWPTTPPAPPNWQLIAASPLIPDHVPSEETVS